MHQNSLWFRDDPVIRSKKPLRLIKLKQDCNIFSKNTYTSTSQQKIYQKDHKYKTTLFKSSG